MSRSFFDLLQDFQAVDELRLIPEDRLAEDGGDLTPEIEAQLAAVQAFEEELRSATTEKLNRATHYLKHLEAEEAALEAKAGVWQAKADAEMSAAKRLAKRRAWMKELMLQAMDRCVTPDAKGRLKLETGDFTLSVKPTVSHPVEIDPDVDPYLLPRQLVKCEISRAAVKEAAKVGDPLPAGIRIGQQVTFSLQVK